MSKVQEFFDLSDLHYRPDYGWQGRLELFHLQFVIMHVVRYT